MNAKNASFDRRQFIKGSVFSCAACVFFSGSDLWAESFIDQADFGPMPYPAPDWLRNAVIIEVPTRGFNVSDYKNPKNWKHPHGDTTYKAIAAKLDFLRDMGVNVLCLYSIYNCTPQTNLYALRYTEPNPDMGSLEDVKELINQAHARGMQVMSNTNHYGAAWTSPLAAEHPAWFLPSSQQRYGQRVFDLDNTEARAHIIDTHVWWCAEVGLDGWRIDCASEFSFKKSVWSEIVTRCADKGKRIVLATEGRRLVGYIQGSGLFGYAPIFDMENHCPLPSATANDPYRCKEISGHNVGEPSDKSGCCAYNSNSTGSCGREGCYRVKGSRFIYGHNSMFAHMVPWMLPGEVFNATHLALPVANFSPKMLHSWLDWTEGDSQQAVVEDFRKINKIREEHKDIFHNNMYETKLINVPCTSTPSSPVKPYARYISGKKAGIVIGNSSTTEDVTFKLEIPLAAMGMDGLSELELTDCWANTTKRIAKMTLNNHSILVPKDKTTGGGVRVLIIAAAL
jgi:pullulanase/glycogen debranching enzyme